MGIPEDWAPALRRDTDGLAAEAPYKVVRQVTSKLKNWVPDLESASLPAPSPSSGPLLLLSTQTSAYCAPNAQVAGC